MHAGQKKSELVCTSSVCMRDCGEMHADVCATLRAVKLLSRGVSPMFVRLCVRLCVPCICCIGSLSAARLAAPSGLWESITNGNLRGDLLVSCSALFYSLHVVRLGELID